MDKNTINLGNQLMFLGVIILEIPSNMVLHKVLRIYRPILLVLLTKLDRCSPMDKWAGFHLWARSLFTGFSAQQSGLSRDEIDTRPR